MNVSTPTPKRAGRVVSLARKLPTYGRLLRYGTPEGAEVILGRRSNSSVRSAARRRGPAELSVLCLHGFCGVPEEMAPAINAARKLGLSLHAPLLPGHGGSPDRLRDLRYADWLDAARHAYDELAQHGQVVVVGMSMGSLLASELCLHAERPAAGLCVLANAMWMRRPFPGTLLRMVDWLKIPDFGFPTPRAPDCVSDTDHPIYHVQPVHAAVSILHAAQRLRPQLSHISAPTLVLHGARDEVCPVSNAWHFAEALGSTETQVTIYPRAAHMLTMGNDSRAIETQIEQFLMQRLRVLHLATAAE